jgi:hypothetical protein
MCETFGESCETVMVEILHENLVFVSVLVRVVVRVFVRHSSTVRVVVRIPIP